MGSVAGIPEVDVGPLLKPGEPGASEAGAAIDSACREMGFFYLVGHGLDPALIGELDSLAREFFVRPESEKAEIAMARAGRCLERMVPGRRRIDLGDS